MISAWLSSVSSIFADLADRLAGDLDLIAVDELAGVLEAELVLVSPAAPEHQHTDRDDRSDERAEGRAACDRHLFVPFYWSLLLGAIRFS